MPTQAEPEITDADLRSIAQQLDSGELDPEQEVDIKSASTADQDKSKAEGSENLEAKTEVTQESQESSPQADEPAKELDYRSEYEKLKKDYERQDRSWKRINEEKENLAKLRQTTRPDEARISGDQFSAEEYEAFAERTIEEGGPDAVKVARQAVTRAKQIREQVFKDQWQNAVRDAIEEEPELGNAESDLAKTVNEILRDPKWAGFKTVVQLAKARKLEASVPGLLGEIETHKKEIERLTKAMEVGSKPGLNKRETPKRFEDMDVKEATAYLRTRAEEADANAY